MSPKEVKRKLKSIKSIRFEIAALTEQIARMEANAEYSGGFKESGMGGSANGNKVEEGLTRLMEYREKLQQKRIDLVEAETRAEGLLDYLRPEESKYRTVLRYRFILCKTQEETANIMNYHWRQLQRVEWFACCLIARRIKMS